MGLDNGIDIQLVSKDNAKNEKAKRKLTRLFKLNKKKEWMNPFVHNWAKDVYFSMEAVYWRKFWGLRNELIDLLCFRNAPDKRGLLAPQDQYEFNVDIDNIEAMIPVAEFFLDKNNFIEYGDQGVWTYEEYLFNMKYQIKMMKKVRQILKWFKRNKYKPGIDFYCYFYDSY